MSLPPSPANIGLRTVSNQAMRRKWLRKKLSEGGETDYRTLSKARSNRGERRDPAGEVLASNVRSKQPMGQNGPPGRPGASFIFSSVAQFYLYHKRIRATQTFGNKIICAEPLRSTLKLRLAGVEIL
ncbi:MAG TPA: hypothetical protein PLW75_01675 [Hyphomicrobium sp.]|nr:hypothetical protein [Hyphomicrobium sp.]